MMKLKNYCYPFGIICCFIALGLVLTTIDNLVTSGIIILIVGAIFSSVGIFIGDDNK